MELNLNWISLSPADATKSLFSWENRETPNALRSYSPPQQGQIAIGLPLSTSLKPCLAIVRDGEAAELLGWIATYTPEAFPLTQSVRVLGTTEFEILSELSSMSRGLHQDFIWASVVLGEMASQGHGSDGIDRLPISRAFGCYSYAVARAGILYGGTGAIYELLLPRLSVIGSNPLFTKKAMSVESLQLIWSLVDPEQFRPSEVSSIVHAIMSALDGPGPASPIRDLDFLNIDVKRMSTGPLEQRVVEFESASLRLVQEVSGSQQLFSRAPMYLAAFAFLVGRGTTHISLLDEFASAFPGVYAWTGLFAGLGGPTCWDGKWLRACTTVDRMIRAPFTLTDPPAVDLAWAEYQLIQEQNHPMEWIKELVKLTPKALSVELVAGASCQMRLSESEADKIDEHSFGRLEGSKKIAQKDIDSISLAVELLLDVVRNADPQSGMNQGSLFYEKPKSSLPAAKKRTKKVK